MALIPWNSFRGLVDFRRVFDSIAGNFRLKARGMITGFRYPAVIDVYDEKDKVVVKAEMPGVERKDILILVSPDSLTIKAECKKAVETKKEDYYHAERFHGAYSRTIALPVPVDEKKTKASLKNGILEIVLPKSGEPKQREWKVEIE